MVERLFRATLAESYEESVSKEDVVIHALEAYKQIVELHQKPDSEVGDRPAQDVRHGSSNATSAMLGTMKEGDFHRPVTTSKLLETLSNNAVKMLEAPSIPFTDKVLTCYVKLQLALQQPFLLPSAFALYHSKPTPKALSQKSFSKLSQKNPNAASSAVPTDVAEEALDAAIKEHSLSLCLEIINETFSHPSHARLKFFQRALVPVIGAVVAPVLGYAFALKLAFVQTTMTPEQATGMAMAGIMTYIGVVGTMGYVTVTTANDQMVRVTWVDGTRLWERWVREEERAALDKVAQAWGFQDRVRWGDEEGEDWEILREWTGTHGMVLDRVELMEGMQ